MSCSAARAERRRAKREGRNIHPDCPENWGTHSYSEILEDMIGKKMESGSMEEILAEADDEQKEVMRKGMKGSEPFTVKVGSEWRVFLPDGYFHQFQQIPILGCRFEVEKRVDQQRGEHFVVWFIPKFDEDKAVGILLPNREDVDLVIGALRTNAFKDVVRALDWGGTKEEKWTNLWKAMNGFKKDFYKTILEQDAKRPDSVAEQKIKDSIMKKIWSKENNRKGIEKNG
jgi:hypothetical protein